MEQSAELAAWIVGVTAALAILWKGFLVVRRKYRRLRDMVARGWGDLFGYDEVLDPADGKVLRPAVKGVATRLADVERITSEAMPSIAMSLRELSQARAEQREFREDISHRLDDHIEQRELWSRDIERELDDHRHRVVRLENAVAAERVLGKQESIQLLKTIESVQRGEEPAD